VILASSSPRRRELLALGGIDFQVRPAALDETVQPGEDPQAYVQRLSRGKAQAAAAAAPEAVIIGADTTVVLDNEILGKPTDGNEAEAMLRQLRGRTHRVLTAISVLDSASAAQRDEVVTAQVPMRAYSDDEIRAYVATGNPLDKAGAYAIQFQGFKPVDAARFTDCFATVMGLPVCRVLSLLEQAGLPPRLERPPANCHHFDAAACPIYPLIDQDGGQ